MSSFFDNTQSVDVSFTVKSLPEKNGFDTVLVGKDIWTRFKQSGRDRVGLSIRPIRPLRKSVLKREPLRELTCWAVLDEEVAEFSVPPKWLQTFGHIFSHSTFHQGPPEKTLNVTAVQPVLITGIIVTALSRDAYVAASSHNSPIETWLSDESLILRQGAVHTFGSDLLLTNGHGASGLRRFCQYRLDMLEPVLQGYAHKGSTRFYITFADSSSEYLSPEDDIEAGDEYESDPDGIEIDECFLASSILHSGQNMTPREIVTDRLQDSNVEPGEPTTSHVEFRFRTEPLPVPTSASQDDCTLYLRTSDLGRIGILNGDWAIVHPSGASSYRLVQIYARDDLVHTAGTAIGSPLLLHNIHPMPRSQISVQAGPFGSNQPIIPVARNVTIARVASPISVDRTYQPMFLRFLKAHFASTKRLVKQGDLIAISLDTDTIGRLGGSQPDDLADLEDLDIFDDYPASSVRLNEVVFFVITNVEHELIQNDGHWSPQDTYIGSTIGELGCWIDSAVTRVVQTGTEHSRIPNVAAYIGADANSASAFLAKLPRQASSHLFIHESSFGKLLALSSATLARGAVDYDLHLSILLKGARGIGKFTVATWVAQRLGMHHLEINCYDVIGENDAETEGTLRARFEKAGSCSPCVLILRYVEALAQTTQSLENGKESVVENILRECFSDLQNTWRSTGYPVLVFGTAAETGRIPPGVLSCFKHEVAFEAPCESERYETLVALLSDFSLAPDVSLPALATQTAALVASDLVDLVDRANFISIERVVGTPERKEQQQGFRLGGVSLTAADFEAALGKARTSYSQSIGAPNIPNVSWDDVGGLAHVKSDILDTVQLPLDHPELFADGLKKRSGILLYGPPGTGKTLLAKAVATSCSLNFFSVKGPELLNMYIGESEANVRRVFQRARDAKPCVIFFDELDSVAPKRGNHGDSGGVMDRIVSQLLAELDGMSAGKGGADVFVIGATNRPDLLDPALLRPGRFDRMLYLGVSDSHDAQYDILQALTRKFQLDDALDLRLVAQQCPFNYTGADFYALCSDAMLTAMSRKAEELEVKIAAILNKEPGNPHPLTPQYYLAEMAAPEDTNVVVTQEDFDQAVRDLVPSVSQSEMNRYASIQQRFSRTKPIARQN
ncbi:hypothetical protein PILCRDRAFT_72673 [Piloderma croceum F 1598]|uniref:Peroxisomal ATPase PEX6 n=1 Tax=Piloderma croceum (strain F 1598) TaxID=765440 RepID=A0A0C3BUA8_PILCF|nr:hypothetical protein PILCRDRAFT_72673 [Piloderma croceum F 1598]